MLIEAHAVDADDQEGGGGEEIFNSSFEQMGGAVRYVVPLGSGRLRASLQLDRVDDLGKAAIDSQAIRAVYPLEDSDRLVLSWLGAPSDVWDEVETTLFYGNYRIVLDRDRASTPTSNRRIDRSDTDARDASLRGIVGREIGGGRLQARRRPAVALRPAGARLARQLRRRRDDDHQRDDQRGDRRGQPVERRPVRHLDEAARPTAGRSGSARAATTSTPRIRAASSATAPRAPRRSPATPR